MLLLFDARFFLCCFIHPYNNTYWIFICRAAKEELDAQGGEDKLEFSGKYSKYE